MAPEPLHPAGRGRADPADPHPAGPRRRADRGAGRAGRVQPVRLPRRRHLHTRDHRPGPGVLLSMTGFGEARRQTDTLSVGVELRAVNNRYLKVTVRCPEPYHVYEPEIERAVRAKVRRGTVNVSLHVQRQARQEDYKLNA